MKKFRNPKTRSNYATGWCGKVKCPERNKKCEKCYGFKYWKEAEKEAKKSNIL